MATDHLYKIAQDPRLFLLLFKLYQSGLVSPKREEIKQETTELLIEEDGKQQQLEENSTNEEAELKREEEQIIESVTNEKQEVSSQIINSTDSQYKTLLDHLISHLGGRTALPDEEYCKLFEGGENGVFFQGLKESFSLKELIQFLHECVIPHHSFSLIKKFPMSVSAKELLQLTGRENDIDAVQKVTGLAISSIMNLKWMKNYSHLFHSFDSMRLVLDLKHNTYVSNNYNSVTKMCIVYPCYNVTEAFSYIIQNWPNLEEIECECYNLVIGKLENLKQIIEITIRDQVHTSVVQNLLTSFPKILKLNVNLRFWLEYHNKINNKTLGVLIPTGQSNLFKLLFKKHRVGSYPFYTIEDPLVSLEDFRKVYCEELGLIGLISNLHQEAQDLRIIANELLCDEDISKVKYVVRKVDRLVDRIDEEESMEFICAFEECLLDFNNIKQQVLKTL
ncbi:predicted protein [Naegleria gruberi]|uniref:Predicted protein n=1 Tax=Naegleria gruberi TaxID=5762 RepID=D2VS88_NAEGR|nr:uncharacterized protein NAEGRDRAFT_51852 [Naegleria gruberi]EFC40382.1 predicted protein [Naegleria gruberi]|eukprot:XP_002673126.1 predicted protein [Naegleria gruberi strain NEG-M]